MKQAMPRTMRTTMWLTIFCFAAAAISGILQVRAQPESMGFVSIDCGLPGTASYVDNKTELSYVPDAAFTDAGSNQNISTEYMLPRLYKRFYNVRSFPDGARNCYTIRPLVAGTKYLIRASFYHGNYDDLGRLPIVFDLYIGVNFVGIVNVSRPDGLEVLEAIVVVPVEYVQVCLVNTGSGTPFISSLELRPLKSSLYPHVNATRGLILYARVNFGETDTVRYPDDPLDRIWVPLTEPTIWDSLSVTNRVTITNDIFEQPSKVMQTAITPRNASSSKNIEFHWDPKPDHQRTAPRYTANMYFAELVSGNAVRQFDVYVNGFRWYRGLDLSRHYLSSFDIYNEESPYTISARYEVSINATTNSTLPPMINAIEVFSVIPTTNVGTDSPDVSAITVVKTTYRVQKNWVGDPCSPKALAWDGLNCSYAISTSPRIISVNLSFSGLSGDISYSFASLKAVQSLDLSHNNFTGSIPDELSQLSSLTSLDLSDNQLSGSIPNGLLKRIQDGALNLRYDNNPNLCSNRDSCHTAKRKSKIAVYISIPVVLFAVIGLLTTLIFCLRRRKKQGPGNTTVKPQNETPIGHVPPGGRNACTKSSLQLENRRFTYNELKDITNNFHRLLGQGGFGKVYDGFLEDGTQVAVKLRSQSSNQGVKEFLAETQILARIHHKNLVSMVGYCKDGQYMALVYEYMPEGTLQEQIAENGSNGRCLTWRQRLRIALESAEGLEYLHKGCNPPLIHRDVKATNILLNSKLEAKIADFGLSKSFNHDMEAHILATALVGTPGYVDPEYQSTMQPSTKSDVYSFGVVLLELITGKSAIILDPTPINIIHWVRQRLAGGNIEGIVDTRMQNNYEVNSVWKVADIALKCTEQVSMQRPTMTDVVTQLQDCLELEKGRVDGSNVASFYTSSSRNPSGQKAYTFGNHSVGLSESSSAFEMEQNFLNTEITGIAGPIAR